MSTITLTSRQEELLSSLVHLYLASEEPVKGDRVAADLGRSLGHVRNQMMAISDLGLVEASPGPEGGYTPTDAAFDALDLESFDASTTVPIRRNGRLVEGAAVRSVDFVTLTDPERCRVRIHVHGPLHTFNEGDRVTAGPSPRSKLMIEGTVHSKDAGTHSLLVSTDAVTTKGE